MRSWGVMGTIGRFKPLHKGSAKMLDAICRFSNFAYIGIGSSNRDLSVINPFTPEESNEMVIRFLNYKGHKNFNTFYIPDFAHLNPKYRDGQKWRENIKRQFVELGGIDFLVNGDEWVTELLGDDYKILHPNELIYRQDYPPISGIKVRIEMVQGGDWQSLVPSAVAEYLIANRLVKRFVSQYSVQTLEKNWGQIIYMNAEQERRKIYEW